MAQFTTRLRNSWLARIIRPLNRVEYRSFDSTKYWEERYAKGGNSGAGSYGELARFKAEVLNRFIREHGIRSVVEWGCGDGHQLSLLEVDQYIGLDVAQTSITQCKERFADQPNYAFWLNHPGVQPENHSAELSLSLDVIYHLIEDDIYHAYLRQVFLSTRRFVIIYSTNSDQQAERQSAHVRHRTFTKDVEERFQQFELTDHIANRYPEQSPAEFFIYRRRD